MKRKNLPVILFTLTLMVFIVHQALCQESSTFFIRPDGIWSSSNNNTVPFITLGMTVPDAEKKIGREPENFTSGILTYISSGKGDPYGFYLYTYNMFTGAGRDNTSDPTIKTIEIWSPAIKTLKGVGVGNTCAEVWKAHGKEYTEDLLNPYSAGFYYKVNNNRRLFFVVGPQVTDERNVVYPSDTVIIRSIAIF